MTYGPKEDPGSRHEASISPTHPTPAVPGHISDQKRLLGEQNITGSVTDAALPILPAIEAQPAANATTESKSASIDKKVMNVTTIFVFAVQHQLLLSGICNKVVSTFLRLNQKLWEKAEIYNKQAKGLGFIW